MLVKTCARCGSIYSQEQWDALSLKGYQRDARESLELRVCRCGKVLGLAVELEPDPAPLEAAPCIPASYYWPPMFFCRPAPTPNA
jgi:hypothetical protein